MKQQNLLYIAAKSLGSDCSLSVGLAIFLFEIFNGLTFFFSMEWLSEFTRDDTKAQRKLTPNSSELNWKLLYMTAG